MPRKKISEPNELQTTERDTVLFYKGRHPLDSNIHMYIVKDSRVEVTFKRKLQRRHSIGYGYPVHISNEGHMYSTKRLDRAEEYWENAKDVALWTRDNAMAEAEVKRVRERDSLARTARELARQIRPAYRRATSFTRLEIIKAFVDELEQEGNSDG